MGNIFPFSVSNVILQYNIKKHKITPQQSVIYDFGGPAPAPQSRILSSVVPIQDNGGIALDTLNFSRTMELSQSPPIVPFSTPYHSPLQSVCESPSSEKHGTSVFGSIKEDITRIASSAPSTPTRIFVRRGRQFSNKQDIVNAPRFYINGATITFIDYVNSSKLWRVIVNNTIPKYYDLFQRGEITSTDCLTWFYDVFYKNVYLYYPEMHHIFKHNLKIQSKALINLVSHSVGIARKVVYGEQIDYKYIYELHTKLGIHIREFLIISELLIMSFEECAADSELWGESVKTSWRNILSVIIDNLLIYSSTYLYLATTSLPRAAAAAAVH